MLPQPDKHFGSVIGVLSGAFRPDTPVLAEAMTWNWKKLTVKSKTIWENTSKSRKSPPAAAANKIQKKPYTATAASK